MGRAKSKGKSKPKAKGGAENLLPGQGAEEPGRNAEGKNGDNAPLILKRFRFVLNFPPEKDQEQHKSLRRMMDEQPVQFYGQLERMEREWREVSERRAASKAGVEAAAFGDEAQAGVEELIGRLLAKLEGGG